MYFRSRILIIGHDVDLASALIDQIKLHHEFQVSHASSIIDALWYIKVISPDLVIVNMSLPDMFGSEMAQKVCSTDYRGSIISLGATFDEVCSATVLNGGEQDYIVKPFRFSVLLACIKSHLGKVDGRDGTLLKIGKFGFNPTRMVLMHSGQASLRLTEKEAAILIHLYHANTSVVMRDVLLKELWGYNANVTTHTLETHIYRLRQKIERDPSNAEILLTEAGGYKLVP